MLQHASSPEPDVVTTLRRCYVNYTGFLFSGEWSSNSPVWCARHCAVKCLSTWLMTSISSPKATDDPFGLPLITCALYHVCTTALETEALALSVREFGTVPRGLRTLDISYKHLKALLKTYVFSTRPRRFVTFYISALEIFLLTYKSYNISETQQDRTKVTIEVQ